MEQPYHSSGGVVVQQAAIRGLAKIGAVAVSHLAREYPRRRAFTKRSIATALGEIGGDEAKEMLGTLLKDVASYEAADSLDRLGDPRDATYIRDELERLMKSSEPVPQELRYALSRSDAELLQPVCRQLLESRDRNMKWAAAESLARQETPPVFSSSASSWKTKTMPPAPSAHWCAPAITPQRKTSPA